MLSFKNPSFEETTSKEWLVTNGIGGYASSTLSGANTRRYHGLLMASLSPPTERQLLVYKVEEHICFGKSKTTFDLSANQFPGLIHPRGYQYLQKFERNPLPKIYFIVDGHVLSKTIFMVHGQNSTVIVYENLGKEEIQLTLRPFFSSRDYHSLFHESDFFDFYCEQDEETLTIHPHFGSKPLYINFIEGKFEEERYWYKNFQLEEERNRGLDYEEDAYTLGKISYVLMPGAKVYIQFTLEDFPKVHPAQLLQEELERLVQLVPDGLSIFVEDLYLAADQLIVWRESLQSYSIIAGYHWFTDWGRDTMIAMRGLTIATNRREVSRSILRTFLDSLDQGQLPNRFPDYPGEAIEYNTIDATLWLFVTLYDYYDRFGDLELIAENFDRLSTIICHHIKGARYHLQVTDEGFLCGGQHQEQLTWMDARVDNLAVTPRHGCPVEIQALWYNALKIYMYFGTLVPKREMSIFNQCNSIQKNLKENFRKYFMNNDGYLNDVVTKEFGRDSLLRPNQIFVLSLPFSLLEEDDELKILSKIRVHLFTPYGLRSLDPRHPSFSPSYWGNQGARDSAYHQGTVWPFLLVEYYVALLKLSKNKEETKLEIVQSLEFLKVHFYEMSGIHTISEIFDGLSPKEGRGAIHQAWSVGSLLRIYISLLSS